MCAKYKTQTGNSSLDIMTILTENYNTNIHSSTKSRPIDLHPNKNNGTINKTYIKVVCQQINKRIKKNVDKQKELYLIKIFMEMPELIILKCSSHIMVIFFLSHLMVIHLIHALYQFQE